MLSDPLVIDDPDYASEEDSDFAPEAAPHSAFDPWSASESEVESGHEKLDKKRSTKAGKRKRESGSRDEAEDVGFENSGDEEIVKGRLRRQKKGKKGTESEDEGGEGGFVKTRRMAALATDGKKKPLANTASATVDVDALWASMTSGNAKGTLYLATEDMSKDKTADGSKSLETATRQQGHDSNPPQSTLETGAGTELEGEDMIMIQRTYNFAGKVHVEEKLVPRDSAEAQLWLLSEPSGENRPQPSHPNIIKPLRPPKKARRSIFEPATESLPQRTDLRFGVNSIGRNGMRLGLNGAPAPKKLNTVEKSKMDWAGFVDEEGIKDELEIAGKAKGAYLDQREFLARVDEKREEEARRARMNVQKERI